MEVSSEFTPAHSLMNPLVVFYDTHEKKRDDAILVRHAIFEAELKVLVSGYWSN